MGETDDKDPPQATNGASETVTDTATTPAEDAKETDKLLKDTDKKAEVTAKDGSKDDVKVNGEEIINIPEDKEAEKDGNAVTDKEPKKVNAEEKEVKPKKIPIGGIKIPGFFTRNKDKSKGGDGDDAENKLLKEGETEEKSKEDGDAEPPAPKKSFLSNLPTIKIQFKNPFAKKSDTSTTDGAVTDEAQENKENAEKADDDATAPIDDTASPTEPEAPKVDGDDEPKADNPPAPEGGKKPLLQSIKLPTLGSLIPKRLRRSNPDDIELGNGPNTRAGLASMETLDDSLKDNDKDVTDKVQNATDEDKMETIKLNDDKDAEKAAEAEQDKVQTTFVERVKTYRCSLDDIAIIGGIIIFIILVLLILLFALSGTGPPKAAPIRDGKYVEAITSCGNVEGIMEDSSFAFRGIPYAISPIGDRRFKPAELIDGIDYCWNDTLKAHSATPHCWQIFANNSEDGVEDCLTLDVITPHVRYDNPLPVVVLIGADALTGESPGKLRPSARYARARDVVFVRPNFRLGVFGFLALKQLSEDVHPPTSGNYGLSDIVAALKWIQLNIAHFGGDPNAVTLFGYRAGATLVTALVSSNATRNLYARAWVSSGSGHFPGRPLSDNERENNIYLAKTGCPSAECLRSKEDEELLNATPDEWRYEFPDLPKPDEDTNKKHEWLVLDGQILSQHPLDVWKDSSSVSAPKIVIGTTVHVGHSDTLLQKYTNWTSEQVRKYVQDSKIGRKGLTDAVFKRYNETYQGLVQIISDIRTVCPLLSLHQSIPSSTFYVVSQVNEQNVADVETDVQAILGRYEPKTFEQRRYVSSIQNMFYYYVSHGSVEGVKGSSRILDIGQDPIPKESLPNCEFWITHDFVPRHARVD